MRLLTLAPFDYRGVKLLFAGVIVLVVGMVLWCGDGLIGLATSCLLWGLPILATGMVMHWRELLRQDREWREYHRNKRQQEQNSSASPR